MSKQFNTGDKVIFNKTGSRTLAGKTGILVKHLEPQHITYSLKPEEDAVATMKSDKLWQVKLDNTEELLVADECWLDKIQ
ncbi:hypothetical protein ACFLT8_04295 [Chloroflexota bacterium]